MIDANTCMTQVSPPLTSSHTQHPSFANALALPMRQRDTFYPIFPKPCPGTSGGPHQQGCTARRAVTRCATTLTRLANIATSRHRKQAGRTPLLRGRWHSGLNGAVSARMIMTRWEALNLECYTAYRTLSDTASRLYVNTKQKRCSAVLQIPRSVYGSHEHTPGLSPLTILHPAGLVVE